MINIRKPVQKPIVVIRAATGLELSNYEKEKLAKIEYGAQVNKIESISVIVNDQKQRLEIDPDTKEVCIDLGELAFKSTITPNELTNEELFLIKCAIDEVD